MREHLDQTRAEASARLMKDRQTDVATDNAIVAHIPQVVDRLSDVRARQLSSWQ